jgi:steroid 5-alpha reductase family enzyme
MSFVSSLKTDNRIVSFTTCFFAYGFALGIAIGVAYGLRNYLHPIAIAFIVDIIATLFIFFLSIIFKNTSLYDPYWSFAPIPIFIYWLIFSGAFSNLTTKQIIVLAIVTIWGIRLTLNWIRGWQGLNHEDWRYTKFRTEKPRIFWFINLTGLQLMPTIIVFLGCLSLYPVANSTDSTIGVLDATGIIVTVIGILMETISDEQLKRFKKTKKEGELMTKGLWRISRHPNYFGQIIFWWGLYFFALSDSGELWWMIIGPIAMTLLFIAVSIPLMEKRLAEKYPQFFEYKKKVSMLIPWFQKK